MGRIVEPRFDTAGKLIQEHDVLRDEETGEMVLVIQGENTSGVKGLGVINEVTGMRDWLDVYPDGVWTIAGNFAVTAEG